MMTGCQPAAQHCMQSFATTCVANDDMHEGVTACMASQANVVQHGYLFVLSTMQCNVALLACYCDLLGSLIRAGGVVGGSCIGCCCCCCVHNQ